MGATDHTTVHELSTGHTARQEALDLEAERAKRWGLPGRLASLHAWLAVPPIDLVAVEDPELATDVEHASALYRTAIEAAALVEGSSHEWPEIAHGVMDDWLVTYAALDRRDSNRAWTQLVAGHVLHPSCPS